MRFVSVSEVRRRFSQYLVDAEKGEVVTITKRGRPVARLMPFVPPNRHGPQAAVKRIRQLRREIGWSASVDEIQTLRDRGRK